MHTLMTCRPIPTAGGELAASLGPGRWPVNWTDGLCYPAASRSGPSASGSPCRINGWPMKRNRLCWPRASRKLGLPMAKSEAQSDHDQEVRQSTALQYRHEHLCHARRPRRHGEGGRGLHRPRRQDRGGHHPAGTGPDHLRAGEQGGTEPAADRLLAPADPLLRRQHADAGAPLSRSLDRFAHARAGEISRADGTGIRGQPVRRA